MVDKIRSTTKELILHHSTKPDHLYNHLSPDHEHYQFVLTEDSRPIREISAELRTTPNENTCEVPTPTQSTSTPLSLTTTQLFIHYYHTYASIK
ncbi:hypothetical protein M8J75_004098 [Diaphorina citri]|nr:hypothetical protein M8J75_004098 [Diaphorina citri]